MSNQKLIFTALPNGTTEKGEGRLSVFISPRLTPGPGDAELLKSFPDWIEWPSHLPQFEVMFESAAGPTIVLGTIDPASPALDLTQWQELFDEETLVRGYQFKRLDNKQIRSYRIKGMHDFLKQQYMETATASPTDFPAIATLKPQLGALRYAQKGDEQVIQALEHEKVPPKGQPFDAHQEFYRFQMFHRPASLKQVALKLPKMDFHEIVGALARYPAIMRQMGLVVDLILPLDVRRLPDTGRVRINPIGEFKTPTDLVTPWTHFVTGDKDHPGEFMAATRPTNFAPEFVHGKLPVADSQRYSVIQMDVDSTAFKTLNLTAELDKLKENRFQFPRAAQGAVGQKTPSASLPAASTTGLTLVHHDEGALMLEKFVASTQHNADIDSGDGTDLDLYLEDLVRGFRIDVWDDSAGSWCSLHRRVGKYVVGKLHEVTIEDEGWAMTGATATPDPTAADQALRIPENIAEWSGWSLSAPRPESVIGTKDEVQSEPGTPDSTFKLKATFTPRGGSLPRLRYGHKYKLLARSVDLAGNGPDTRGDRNDPDVMTDFVTFRRYEPITQPVLIPRHEYKESESIEHLVVRTWTTPPTGTPTTEFTERHVAPPITTMRGAELHGALDDPAGPGGYRADAYAVLTGLEGSAPSDPVTDENWRLNYLADPAAHGAAFTGLPGTGGPKQFEFDTDPWPKYHPFLLHVDGGTGAPTWDTSGSHVLKVQVPPAVVARVRLSSYTGKKELVQQMGAWRWVMEKYNPAHPEVPPVGNPSYDQLYQLAMEGRHWMITPYREILLIHAVQQPLVAPKFTYMGVSRTYGSTFATIRYASLCDGKSTQKLDMSGTWSQNIDDITQPAPETIQGAAHAFTTSVDPDVTGLESAGRHEFGDTKHRKVNYSGTMLTRFPEFFPEGTTPLTRTTDETGGPYTIHVPSSARPEVPHIQFVIPVFEWVKTSPVTGMQQMTRKGNTVRVYLDRPWYSSGDDEKLGVIMNVVPQYGTGWTPEQVQQVQWHYQTGWGLDPIVAGGPVSNPLTAAHFSLGGPAVSNLSLDDVPNSMATVIPHEVVYDPNQKLWYCDIRVEPDAGSTAYWPFLRLALARYQPYAIQNAHLSRIAQADFIQLAPDRTASITPANKSGDYNVSLAGPYASVSGTSAPSHKVQVTVERQDEGGDDFGWTPVGQPADLNPLWTTIFLGTVKVPLVKSSKYRLVFKEYEKLVADAADRSLTGSGTSEVWRLVFAHDFAL